MAETAAALKRRIRTWPRIRFTRGGWLFTLGSAGVGLVALRTGNNLLYLLFGAMLGLITVSGWLSEQVLRRVTVRRRVPRGVTVGNTLRIQYQVRNGRKRIPGFALEVGDVGLPGTGFVPTVAPGNRDETRSENTFVRRGVFPLTAVTISTGFPFGLFRKSRSIPLPGEVLVWPRTDRANPSVRPQGGLALSAPQTAGLARGLRGDYRGLRSYRPGDDPRDIHWRTSARLGQPVVKEYEDGDSETLWICLDSGSPPGERAEETVEMAASLASMAFRAGRSFGLVTSGFLVEAGTGPGHMEAVLDALARVDFDAESPPPRPPVARRQCVLITARPGENQGFGDVLTPQTPNP